MWLLKFHIAFSILCIITFYGFYKVYKDQIRRNGWLDENKKKKIFALFIFFVPIMNVLILLTLFMMIFVNKREFEEFEEYVKEESEEK